MVSLTGTQGPRTLTAFFDDQPAAQKAVDELVGAGIPNESIRLAEGVGTTAVDAEAKATAHKGFWDELKDLFLPDQDRHSYAEGLSRGGYLLSVNVDEAAYPRALEILDTGGAVDMDSREAEWTASGWSSTPLAAPAVAPGAMGESELLGDVASTSTPAPMVRDTVSQQARLRSYSAWSDSAPGIPDARSAAGPSTMTFDASRDRARITEHMEVIAADGASIGTVDHLDGPDRIKLTRSSSPDGQHHFVPLTWVDHVDARVHLNRSLADIKAQSTA